MNAISPLVAWLLVVVTLGVSAYFARQQFRTLADYRDRDDLSAEDARYFRRQAYRRLFGCFVLATVGIMIGGSYLSGQEDWAEKFGEQKALADAAAKPTDPETQQRQRVYAWYWIAVLLLLLVLVMTALFDFLAIRGYATRHLRIISDDRKAYLERELEQLRRDRGRRNGKA